MQLEGVSRQSSEGQQGEEGKGGRQAVALFGWGVGLHSWVVGQAMQMLPASNVNCWASEGHGGRVRVVEDNGRL